MTQGLAEAEAALARGDYGQCLAFLKPLLKSHPLPSEEGGKIGILMVTAYMGLGDEQTAVSTCRLITKCKNNELRQRAKQLLQVLEAPSLQRPKNWSVRLPNIEMTALTGKKSKQLGRQSIRSSSLTPPPPPTGPTQGLGIGFSSLVLIVLIGLTVLLSGCVQITTEINLTGPDQINLGWELESTSQKLLPWQVQFQDILKKSVPKVEVSTTPQGSQKIITPSLSSKEANLFLQNIYSKAANASGIKFTNPELTLSESNWLIGIKQDLSFVVDLTELPNIPGLNLAVRLSSTSNPQDFIPSTRLATKNRLEDPQPLILGELNKIEIHRWRWNVLGIGSILILFLLAITLTLQSIRLKLGFGFPELPP